MQASVTQLILLAVAVAVAAIVAIVVFNVVRDEGDNLDLTRNQAAYAACQQAGGSYFVFTSAADAQAGTRTAAQATNGVLSNGQADILGECDF